MVPDGYPYISSSSSSNAVRPCMFLKPAVKITGGTGYVNDPYTIGL